MSFSKLQKGSYQKRGARVPQPSSLHLEIQAKLTLDTFQLSPYLCSFEKSNRVLTVGNEHRGAKKRTSQPNPRHGSSTNAPPPGTVTDERTANASARPFPSSRHVTIPFVYNALAFCFPKRRSAPNRCIFASPPTPPASFAHYIYFLFSNRDCAVRGFVRTHFLPFTRSDRESRTTLHLLNLWNNFSPSVGSKLCFCHFLFAPVFWSLLLDGRFVNNHV